MDNCAAERGDRGHRLEIDLLHGVLRAKFVLEQEKHKETGLLISPRIADCEDLRVARLGFVEQGADAPVIECRLLTSLCCHDPASECTCQFAI